MSTKNIDDSVKCECSLKTKAGFCHLLIFGFTDQVWSRSNDDGYDIKSD